MARKSPVYYIAPSAISIVPNANGKASDLAVYVARDTKIRIYTPGIKELGMVDETYQEWTFSGRNRRLADSTKPYTIYARLRKVGDYADQAQVAAAQADGYLLFVAQVDRNAGTGEAPDWHDKYNYVTWEGLTDIDGALTDQNYWYIRLGDVKAPDAGQRSTDLDTGILGTDLYNMDWASNPADQPLRVEIGCTIDDEDAGNTPYVAAGGSLVLIATLMRGFAAAAEEEDFDHWEVSRNTGDADADALWPDAVRKDAFAGTGSITISHVRGDGDDFRGLVAVPFTVMAMKVKEPEPEPEDAESELSGEPEPVAYEPIASASITIYAEAADKYEIVLSDRKVVYDTEKQTYTPEDGVTIRIRTTDQRGDAADITYGQLETAGLAVEYTIGGSAAWTDMGLGGPADETVAALVPVTAFVARQDVHVRLVRVVEVADPASPRLAVELTRQTIAFELRQGQVVLRDREWIFLRSRTSLTFGGADSSNPEPSAAIYGEVNPEGIAAGDDADKNQDRWIPNGWQMNDPGTDDTWYYVYASYRDWIPGDGENPARWGDFIPARVWHQYNSGGGGGAGQYLSKNEDDEASGLITFLKGIKIGVQKLFGWDDNGDITANDVTANDGSFSGGLTADGSLIVGSDATVSGDATVNGTIFANQSVRTDEIRSSNYTGDTVGDTGYLLTAGLTNGLGHSKLTIDEIYVRMKAVFESLEVRKWNVVAGDEIRSCAANIINRVDYFTDTGTLLGYSEVRVPWMMKRVPFLLRLFGSTAVADRTVGRWLYSKVVKMRVTIGETDLRRIRYCRCYFLANDGDTQIENWWRADAENGYDLARCQTMNVVSTARNTYTSIHRKEGNVFWWRKVLHVSKNGVDPSENPDTTHCQPAIIDDKTYHWFDVALNGAVEYDSDGEMTGRTDGNCMAYSDIPAAGDHAVQFGNTTNPGRMNLWITMVSGGSTRDYDPDGDAPCIKAFTGIYTFDLSKCFTGGHPCKMTLAPGKKYWFYGRDFRFIKEYGTVPSATDRGEWVSLPLEKDEFNYRKTYSDDIINTEAGTHTRAGGKDLSYARKCYWYDVVSHNGGTWLCTIGEGSHWVVDTTFTQGGTTYTQGQVIQPGTYSALSEANKVKCSSHENYTTDEPSMTSSAWTSLTTGITTKETRYRKKARLKKNATSQKYEVDPTAGTTAPAESWDSWYTQQQWNTIQQSGVEPKPENQVMQDGDYMWSLTRTEFSSKQPMFEYSVVRWGIDADGIIQDSYYLGLADNTVQVDSGHDSYPMPGTPAWTQEPRLKWFGTFDAMATANGGIGAMQGWMVWEKTVITYDPDPNRAPDEQKPDLVNYKASRIGQDGQIAEEEYYMLAASDNFNTVFGSSAPAKNAIGIVWYNQGNPASERYRLAANTSTQSNINTTGAKGFASTTPFWTPVRPVYDKDTHGDKIYLWNFEYRADGQGTPYATRPVCIGNHARGIVGMMELYALSTMSHAEEGRLYPSDIRNSGEADEKDWWTDEIYDRAPEEALPYQWNKTVTIYNDSYGTKGGQTKKASEWTDRTGVVWDESSCDVFYHVSSVKGTKGEDGAGTEYIYCNTTTNQTPSGYNGTVGTANGKSISGTVVVNGQRVNKCQAVDDFVPNGWSDNPLGIAHDRPFEWVCERKSIPYSGTGDFSGGHLWGEFSEPKPRSNWGKNGIDGDGTEYVFIRTKTDTPPVLLSDDGGTAAQYQSQEWKPYVNGSGRTDIETNEGTVAKPRCTDDPKGTTRDWPYEWAAVRHMGSYSTDSSNYGHRDWMSYYDSMTDHKMSRWSTYTTLRLDIDNEMDMVRTSSLCVIESARTVETVVHLYDGATEVTLGAVTVSGGPGSSIATYSQTASGSGRKLSWSFIAGKTMSAVYEISISYTYNNVPYSATFTIAASMGQPVYQLKPTLNSINFVRKSDNTLDPSGRTLGLDILKIDGQSTNVVSLPSGYTVRWKYDSMPTGTTDGNSWTSGNVATVSSSTDKKDVCIILFYGTVVIDRETIPIVKDGAHGENSVRIDLDNENDSMLYSSSKGLVSGSVTSKAYMFDGASDVSASTTFSISAREGVTDAQATINTETRVITVTGMNAATAKVTVQGVYTDGHGQKHTKTATLTLKKIVDGDKYDLVITPNAIAYNSSTDTPATTTVTVEVWRMSVDGTRAKAAPPTGYATYLLDGTTQLKSSSASSFTYEVDNSARGDITVKIAKGYDSTEYLDCETIPINKTKNGENSVRIDLDNENDSMLYSSAKGLISGSVTTTGYLYDGISDVSSSATWSIKSSSGCTATISGRTVTVTAMSAASGSVVVQAVYGGKTYTATLTLKKIIDGDKYDLVITPNAIAYNASTDTPATTTVTVEVWRMSVDGTRTKAAPPTGYATYLLDGTTQLKSSSASSFTYEVDNSARGDITVKIAKGYDSTDYLDCETIPIAKAENGTSPWIADLDNEMDSVSCDDRGYPVKSQSVKTNLSLFYGSAKQNFKVTSVVRRYGTNNGSTSTYSSNTTSNGVTVSLSSGFNTSSPSNLLTVTYATSAVVTGKDIFTITMTDGSGSNSRELNFTVNGVIGDVYNLLPWENEIAAKFDGTTYKVNGSTSYYLKCGYTKNVDGSVTTVKDVTDGVVDGKYYIFCRVRRRSDQKWQNWSASTQQVTYDEGANIYPMYNRLKNGTTSVDINTYDAFEIVLTALGASQTGGYATADIQAIDREIVYVISDGADGTSPWIADLDNEMDSVSCYDNGKPIKAQSVQTKLAMYYGSSPQDFTVSVSRNSTSMTIGTAKDGVTVSYNTSSRIMTVAYTTSATVKDCAKDDYEITLTSSDGSSTKRVLHLTVNAVSGDVYNLLPGESQISVGRTASGDYRPSTYDLRCGYTRKDIEGNISTVTDVTGQIDSKYNVYFRTHLRSSQSWSSLYYPYVSYKSTVTSLNISSYDAVEFVLCTNTGGTTGSPSGIIDRETVPVVADGLDGEDGADGTGGVYLSAHDIYYARNNSGTSAPTTGWGTSVLDPTSSQRYVWRKDVWTYDAPERGRNMWLGSANLIVGKSYSVWKNGTGTVDTTTSGLPITGIENACVLHANDNNVIQVQRYGILTLDAKYLTLSFYAKGSSSVGVSMYPAWMEGHDIANSVKTVTVGTDWQRYSHTVKINTVADYQTGLIRINANNSGKTVTVCGMKLEYGDTPTDWCKAPEDLNREEVSVWSVYGEDAVVYTLQASANVVSRDKDKVPLFDVIQFYVDKTVGATTTTVSNWVSEGLSLYYKKGSASEVSVDAEYGTASGVSTDYHDIESLYDSFDGVVEWRIKKGGVIVARLGIGTTDNGQDGVGRRGKAGRFYYYAGNYSDFASSSQFIVSDAQAPYFFYNDNYWVFNPEANGTYSKSQMGTPSVQSSNWELMTSEFKYIITEAIFGNFAKFGASIMNGDYMMSQYVIAKGFLNTIKHIDNGTKYQYIETDDVLGENTMYDQSTHPEYFPYNWGTTIESNYISVDSTSYNSSSQSKSTFRLDWAGCMYSVEIEYHSDVALDWKVSAYSYSTAIDSGSLPAAFSEEGVFYTKSFFIATSSASSTSLRLFFKLNSSGSYGATIRGIKIRRVKFVPTMAIDMLRGKMVLSDLVARGELHADSFYYTSISGNNNNDTLYVGEESIVMLGTVAAGTKVVLPSPSSCKGRKIEVHSIVQSSYSWKVSWNGASSSSYFLTMPTVSGSESRNYLRAGDSIGASTYALFYSDGSHWWILKCESVVVESGRAKVVNNLYY